jgi:adenylate cyclase class 2
MSAARKEIEIKLPFDSPSSAREALARIGAREIEPRHFEDNVLFDRERDALKPAGKTLRLRRADGQALITFKSLVANEGRHKVREEWETTVGDPRQAHAIIEALGFTPSYRYQKHRTVYELDGLHLCLDETPLGCFVELEGAPEAIDRVAAHLGFTVEQYVRLSYRSLHEQAARDRGEAPASNLLLEGESRA